jgi:hypothetical protein
LASALTAAVIGFVVGAFFLSLAYQEMFFTVLALVVGLHKVARLDAAEALRPAMRPEMSPKMGAKSKMRRSG